MKNSLLKWMLDGKIIEIIYASKQGQFTQRKIKIFEVKDNYIKAYCFLRDEVRTFHFDQILSAFPLKNGENARHRPYYGTKQTS